MKAVLFLGLGVALLLTAAMPALGVQRFRASAQVADGQVVALNAGGSHPQVEFVDPDGPVRYPQNGLIFGYRPGERVRVLFRRDDPAASATIDTLGALWFWPLLAGVIGLAFAAGGLLPLLARRG